jgi:predicted MPP superfamily phosphohydrolase
MTILVLALLALSCWYAPGRILSWLGFPKAAWPARILTLMAVAGYMAVLMSGWYVSESRLAGFLYNWLGVFLIFQSYLLFLTATADLMRLAARRRRLGRRAAVVVLAATLLPTAFGLVGAQRLSVTRTVIEVADLPAPVSILHAPDLHLGHQRGAAWLERTVSLINGLEPDLVVYNGDLADSDVALTGEVFDLFREVSAPQYYTTGNHEFYIDTAKVLTMAEAAGLTVLRNRVIETAGLQLAGLEYMNADARSSDAHRVNDLTMDEELPKLALDSDRPVVLLHHSPVGLEYAERAGVDVMLSGHTHGGQVFPGTLLIRARFPFWRGLHKPGPTALLVSQGGGTFGPMLRLGSFNEIQLVDLVPADGLSRRRDARPRADDRREKKAASQG